MDRDVIERKLESLRRYVSRVESKKPFTRERLEREEDLQDIIAQNLTQAVQTSVDIGMHILTQTEAKMPETMAEVFDGLHAAGVIQSGLAERMKKAVGFRNIAVHAYGEVDWAIVFDICKNRLSDFSDFARCVAEHVLGAELR